MNRKRAHASATFATPACESPFRRSEPQTDNDIEEHGSSPHAATLNGVQSKSNLRSADTIEQSPLSANDFKDGSNDPDQDKKRRLSTNSYSRPLKTLSEEAQELLQSGSTPRVVEETLQMLGSEQEDSIVQWATAYQVLATRLRSTSGISDSSHSSFSNLTSARGVENNSDMAALIPHLPRLVDFWRRDLDEHAHDEVAHEALKLLGFMLYTPRLYTSILTNQLQEIIRMILNLARATQSKTTCHLCIWIWRMQRLPAKLFTNSMLTSLVEVVVYGLKSPFQSTTIPTEAIQALDVLLKSMSANVMQHANLWLLPMYACMYWPNDLVRKHAIEFFSVHLPTISQELDSFDPFLYTFYERNNARLIYEITELTNRNERDGMKLWSFAIVLLSKYIQKSPSFVNGMLKIVERCFNVKKASSKLYGYRAWSFLIYSFASTKYLLHERRIKLLMIPILNSFTHDRHAQLRLEATQCWINLVFALGKCTNEKEFTTYFPLIEVALPKLLTDEVAEIRECGWKVFDALTQTERAYNNTRLTVILGNSTKPSDHIKKLYTDPKWTRLNICFFLNTLKARHEYPEQHDDYILSEQQSRLISKRVREKFVRILCVLNLSFQKEIHLNSEGQVALIRIGEFLGEILHSTAVDSDKMDVLYLMLTSVLEHVPSRHLNSLRCSHTDLEETCRLRMKESPNRDLFRHELKVTPIVHILLLWLESCEDDFPDDPDRNRFYWDKFQSLTTAASEESAFASNMYSLVYILDIQPTSHSAARTLKYWCCIASATQAVLKNASGPAEFNPFDDVQDDFLHSIMLWPLHKLLDEMGRDAHTKLPHEWQKLWIAIHETQLSRTKDPDKMVYALASSIMECVHKHDGVVITEGILVVLNEVFQAALSQNLNLIACDASENPKLMAKAYKAEKRRVLQDFTRWTLSQSLVLMEQAMQADRPGDMLNRLAGPFSAVTDSLLRLKDEDGARNALHLVKTCQAHFEQLFDQHASIASKTAKYDEGAQKVVKHAWLAILAVCTDESVDQKTIITNAGEILRRALCHSCAEIADAAIALWNSRFGSTVSVELPDDLQKAVCQLASDSHSRIQVPVCLDVPGGRPEACLEDGPSTLDNAYIPSTAAMEEDSVVAGDSVPDSRSDVLAELAAAISSDADIAQDNSDDAAPNQSMLNRQSSGTNKIEDPLHLKRQAQSPSRTSSSSKDKSMEARTPSRNTRKRRAVGVLTAVTPRKLFRQESQTDYKLVPSSRDDKTVKPPLTSRQIEKATVDKSFVPPMCNSHESQRFQAGGGAVDSSAVPPASTLANPSSKMEKGTGEDPAEHNRQAERSISQLSCMSSSELCDMYSLEELMKLQQDLTKVMVVVNTSIAESLQHKLNNT